MKSKRSKACDIGLKIRKNVIDRDCGCVVCGKTSQIEIAHFIPRSSGGLGIEKNLVVLCKKHHHLTDQSINRKQYLDYIESYLKSKYLNWSIEELKYRKGGVDE